jgi:signal transduction histidine kinase
MLLGLPAHLAPQSTGRAVARACHVIACVMLGSASLVLLINQATRPGYILWPALVAVATMIALIVVVERRRTATAIAAYLAIGSAGTYWYAITLLAQVPAVQASDAFSLSLPKIALIMVGGSGRQPRFGLLCATIAFVLGEVGTQAATWQTGQESRFDVATTMAYVLVLVTVGWGIVARDRARRAQPSLHRAALDQQMQGIRHDIEQQAAALLHDTVLSHLAAVATSAPGPLDSRVAKAMSRDLETLVGREWLAGGGTEVSARDWHRSELAVAVESARDSGLEVGVTGDVSAVARLRPDQVQALGLAVAQCLVNVERHSGTSRAEVVVYGDGDDVSVMVIDDGVGFDPRATGADRLGIKNSVQARMERVGGSVQIWSSPGSGTSVVIRVAVDGAPGSPTASSTEGTEHGPGSVRVEGTA